MMSIRTETEAKSRIGPFFSAAYRADQGIDRSTFQPCRFQTDGPAHWPEAPAAWHIEPSG